jgi:hypothetical protein
MDFRQQERFQGENRLESVRGGDLGLGAGSSPPKTREKQGVGRRHVKEQAWLKASRNWKT